jgi:site-specific DNA-cytosine methylase
LNHGLPQKRERTFFLMYRADHVYFDVYKYADNPVTINDLIGDLEPNKLG